MLAAPNRPSRPEASDTVSGAGPDRAVPALRAPEAHIAIEVDTETVTVAVTLPSVDAARTFLADPGLAHAIHRATGAEPDDSAEGVIPAGTEVEVRNRYQGEWCTGFEVVDSTADGYLVRRSADGRLMPERFPAQVIRDRRR